MTHTTVSPETLFPLEVARAFLDMVRVAPAFERTLAADILAQHAASAIPGGRDLPGSQPDPAPDPGDLAADLAKTLQADGSIAPAGTCPEVVAQLRALFAEGRDPFADCAVHGQTCLPQTALAGDLAALLACARLFADRDTVVRLTDPASVTLLRCDPGRHVAMARLLHRHLIPAALAWHGLDAGDLGDNDDQGSGLDDAPGDLLEPARFDDTDDDLMASKVGILIASPRSASSSRDRPFMPDISGKLGQGLPVIVLCAARADVPPDCLGLVDLDLALPRCDTGMVLAMLRLTQSRSGQVAEAALRAALPPDDDLARLLPAHLDAAFARRGTLQVAARIARIAAASSGRARCTLDDLRGAGAARSELDRIVRDVIAWRAGRLAWRKVTASVLLYGPPGCGKTMAAEATAGSAACAFVTTSYADLQSAGHLGQMLERLNQRIAEASQAAPCVFFLDELDSFGHRHEGGRSGSYMTAVVNGMLEALGRLAQVEGVVVIGATNHPDKIDPALIRSGRFDRKIALPPPDRDGIAAILRAHLGDGGDWGAQLPAFTAHLLGASGADVAAVARMAQSRARDRGEDAPVQAGDIAAALDGILPTADPTLAHRFAVHEAGHAIVGAALGRAPTALRVGPNGGETVFAPLHVHTHASAMTELAVLMAGRAAEALVLRDPANGAGLGRDSDLAIATDLALKLELNWGFGDAGCVWHGIADPMPLHTIPPWLHQKLRVTLAEAETRADAILRAQRGALMALVETLVKEREITGTPLAALLPTAAVPRAQLDSNVIEFRALERPR